MIRTKAGAAAENGSATLISKPSRIGRSEWAEAVPGNEWCIYARAIREIRPLGWPFLLGGAFGLACHTGRWRNTKDLDFFVLPETREDFIRALSASGFVDYFAEVPYDRGWIYRGIQQGMIVDIIWDTPNRRCPVDEQWMQNAVHVEIRGEALLAIPPEELLFIKAFVLQKDRCDWTDLVNLLSFQVGHIDWERVIWRFGPELPLLRAILNVFAWVCPIEAPQIPEEIRSRLGVEIVLPENPEETMRTRVNLLDSRPWFAAFEPVNAAMKI